MSTPPADRPGSRYFIGASSKAYLGERATYDWLNGIRAELDARPQLSERGITAFVIPSAPLLVPAREILAGSGCLIGAQDAHWSSGAATGGVSTALLAELGISLVELGHAERRRDFRETDDDIARKVRAALDDGLVPLLCIGETDAVPAQDAASFCIGQVRSAVRGAADLGRTILAYEPVWAIGADRPASSDHVNSVLSMIRAGLIAELGTTPLAEIYGGSAGPGTLVPLVEADGLFLGRFAHDPANFGVVLDDALALVA